MPTPAQTYQALRRFCPVTMKGTCPIPLNLSRRGLAKLNGLLKFTAGAEVGVWKGAYSALLAREAPRMVLHCVDPWQSYPEWLDTKNSLPPIEAAIFMDNAHAEAVKTLKGFPNVRIVQAFSIDAAKNFADRSLDFVYIDANHTLEGVTADLNAWVPKVRAGGIVSGHDYRVFGNKPFIHVVEAVKAYTKAHDIVPWFILAKDKTPSFLWVVN